ncbi:MAG: ArsR family transcriptional regulator [Chloroflexota bacterium]|nr:MAG: ArsR family transcriptional regulator [Chloroflexota bacterium]
MQHTRQEIVSLLREKGERTVRELAGILGLTQMSVRLHLTVLQREGMVSSREVHQPIGRPYFAYSLTEQAEDLFPKAYWRLADRLLSAVQAAGQSERIVETYVDDLTRRYRYRFEGREPAERVRVLADVLTEEGLTPRIEQDGADHIIRACNCPYDRVARVHPDVCDAETSFIGRSLGDAFDVKRESSRLDGSHQCVYRLRLRSADELATRN